MLRRDFLRLALATPALSSCWIGNAIGRNVIHSVDTPLVTPKAKPDRVQGRLAITWIGHATMLVQLGRNFVLTDPMFMPTVGQLAKRRIEPGIYPEHLPFLDAVVISHMHQDHYSPNSLELFEKKIGRLLLPENGLLYAPNGPYPIRDMTTWQRDTRGAVAITQVPVKHSGWRYALDASWMPRGFCGWVLEWDGITVFFGGDTGYDKERFSAVRERFPRIDLALLPIGPVEPRKFHAPVHMGPREALDAADDLGARVMIPMHYDTFWFGDDQPGEAIALLRTAMGEKRVDESRVRVADVGVTMKLL